MLCLLLAATAPAASQPTIPTEYQVKAAFLYNFGRFVTWPARAFADSTAPLLVGILGEDPFGTEIDAMLRGKTLEGRPVQVQRFQELRDLGPCHILFTARSDPAFLQQLFATLRGRPVLTVGESTDFTSRGGVIRFYLEENRVRFEINVRASQRAELWISSKLLKLARIVGEESER
jgi:uncharacterized protein DUF4154